MLASASSWKHEPFLDGVPLGFSASYSNLEFSQLKVGIVPKEMEDKWFVFFDEPYLFFHRSWTGKPVYRIALQSTEGGADVSEALWETGLASSIGADRNYQAQLLDFLVSNLLLGQSKPFPLPAINTASAPGVFQHHAAGTGFPERPAKRWWRFGL